MSGLSLYLQNDLEASRLRELLSQTASPGSFQAQLIARIDAAVEESKRPRKPLTGCRPQPARSHR